MYGLRRKSVVNSAAVYRRAGAVVGLLLRLSVIGGACEVCSIWRGADSLAPGRWPRCH